MRNNRLLLCLLICGLLLYYAVPRLSVFSEGAEGIFAVSWLAFALFVIAGNLTALLYSPKKKAAVKAGAKSPAAAKKRVRSFYR